MLDCLKDPLLNITVNYMVILSQVYIVNNFNFHIIKFSHTKFSDLKELLVMELHKKKERKLKEN